ncbi:hypothetical protein C8R44DRAFT_876545 [Mycena epipterygia]|nr:hypothetical protein C8R44DRAFT_876545 [Mycena epipterygia]
MFSKFLILGLSALSIVCAGPTPLFSAEDGVVKLALVQNHTIAPGRYKISQPFRFDDPKYLTAQVRSHEPQPLITETLKNSNYIPTWWVEKVGDDKFRLSYIYLYRLIPAEVLHPPIAQINVVAWGGAFLSTWTVEKAGRNQWIIKVPDADLVWTTSSDSTVTLEKANDTPAQRWNFELK